MKRLMKTIITLVLVSLPLPCLAADATYVFTDKATFLASVGEVVLQGFESYPTNVCTTGGPNPATSLVSESFIVTTVPAQGGTSFLCTGAAADGPGPTEGNNALIAGSNTGSTWTLDFQLIAKPPTFAVGFYLTDAAETGDAIFVTSTGEEVLIAQCCRPSGSTVFFGLISNKPFRSFQLRNTGVGDGWGIDELMLGIGGRSNKPH